MTYTPHLLDLAYLMVRNLYSLYSVRSLYQHVTALQFYCLIWLSLWPAKKAITWPNSCSDNTCRPC